MFRVVLPTVCLLIGLVAGGAARGQTAAAPDRCDSVIPITQAQRSIERGGAVLDRATVTALDTIARGWQREDTTIRYHIRLDDCAAQAGRALWLYRIGAPYRVTVDGQPLQAIQPFAPAVDAVYNGRVTALFALPAGARELDIVLVTLPYVPSGLIRAAVGPQEMLMPEQARHYRGLVEVNDISSAVVLMVGLLAMAVWSLRRKDMQILWFGLACLAWALRGLVYQTFALSGNGLLMEQLNPFLVLVTAACISASTLSTLQAMNRRRGQALAALVVLALTSFVLAHLAGRGAQAVRTLAFATALLLLASLPPLLLARQRLLGVTRSLLLALGYVAVLAGAGHDIMMVIGPLQPDHWSYLTPGFTVLLLCYTVVVSQYLVRSLNRAERSNEELEHNIQAKTSQLEASYALLRDSERESARTQEREHLLREMHDGLGAQLMTALRGVERGALAREQVLQALQDSLDDLRLLMDSADMGRQLQGALAAWRNRWDPRLTALGIELDWLVDDLLDDARLSPDAVLQVMRILQEATANVVKHANAVCMQLKVWCEAEALCLYVQDNGAGLPQETPRPGARGLRNMQNRARLLGGQLTVASVAPPGHGTRVDLRLPLGTNLLR